MKHMREQIKLKKRQMIDELVTLRAQHKISQERTSTLSALSRTKQSPQVLVNDYLSTNENRMSTLDYSKTKFLRNTSLATRDSSPPFRSKGASQLATNLPDDDLCNTLSNHGVPIDDQKEYDTLNTKSMDNLSPARTRPY